MSIRRKIRRKKSLNMSSIDKKSLRDIAGKLVGDGRASIRQLRNPDPGKAPECNLKAAGPIDSHTVRITFLPVIPLLDQFAGVLTLRGQAICFCQRDQMLVAA